jgi:hypothetical protein
MSDVLAAEIAKPEYAGMSDDSLAAAINAKRVAARRLVPTWEVRRAAIEGGYWPALVLAAADANDARRGLAISVLAWIDDQSGTIQTIDMDRPSTQQMLAGLVAAGFVTQTQADGLNALADTTIAWTESVGLPEIGRGLLNNARKING